jgi:integrase
MARVYKRTRNGRDDWVADYTDQHGARHRLGFPSRKEAERRLVAIQGEVARGLHTPEHGSLTVAEAGERYLRHCRAERLADMTIRHYSTLVRLHIVESAFGIGQIKVAALTAPQVEEFRLWLLETHRTRIGLAKRILQILRGILAIAQKQGQVAQNVALEAKIRLRRGEKKKLQIGIDIPDVPDIELLLAHCRTKRFARFRPFLLTAVTTGMRVSEIRGLPWSAVDFKGRTITVRQSANDLGAIIPYTKTEAGMERQIQMCPELVEALRAWRFTDWWSYAQHATPRPRPANPHDLVFPSRNGTPLAHNNVMSDYWYPLQLAAGMHGQRRGAKYHFHGLRHFYASYWLREGLAWAELTKLMGHASIAEVHKTYGHLFPGDRDIINKFDKFERLLGLGGDGALPPNPPLRLVRPVR